MNANAMLTTSRLAGGAMQTLLSGPQAGSAPGQRARTRGLPRMARPVRTRTASQGEKWDNGDPPAAMLWGEDV